MKNESIHIALVIGSMRMGGAERATARLANALSRPGNLVDLVMVNETGNYLPMIHSSVRRVNLARGRAIHSILPFKDYLKKEKPDVIIASQRHVQVMVLLATKISRSKIPVVLIEHSTWSKDFAGISLKESMLRLACRSLFPSADALVAVSAGSAGDLGMQFPSLVNKIKVIYNPVVDDELLRMAEEPLEHVFLEDRSIPLVLAAGRMVPSKDFITLVKALSIVQRQRRVRLVILGEGEEREKIGALAAALNLAEDLYLPGAVENPYAWMKQADLFVLSSLYEGFPMVLAEALACGCPVLSTDCPYGPREILCDGKFGMLVPPGNAAALAAAILQSLNQYPSRNALRKRGNDFNADMIAMEYLELARGLIQN